MCDGWFWLFGIDCGVKFSGRELKLVSQDRIIRNDDGIQLVHILSFKSLSSLKK